MDLDLKEIASTSLGLTGADLNAIITQAKLAAFEDAVRIIPVNNTNILIVIIVNSLFFFLFSFFPLAEYTVLYF